MWLRIVTAVAALVSGLVHLKLWWVDGFRDIDVIGPAFMLNAVAGVVIAVLLLTWRHWIPAFLAAGLGASVLGAFIISTTPAGLFGVHERWEGIYVFVAAASEVVCLVGGLVLLAREWRARQRTGATTAA